MSIHVLYQDEQNSFHKLSTEPFSLLMLFVWEVSWNPRNHSPVSVDQSHTLFVVYNFIDWQVKSLKVADIIRGGLRRFTDSLGQLWNSLADFYIRSGHFEKVQYSAVQHSTGQDRDRTGQDNVHSKANFSCLPALTLSWPQAPLGPCTQLGLLFTGGWKAWV